MGRTVINLAVIVVAGVVLGWYALASLLDERGADARTVTLVMPDAGGIATDQAVTARGHHIGTVRGLRLTRDGVEVDVAVRAGEHLPANPMVQVLRRSPIGEQTIDLTPVPPTWEPPDGPLIPARVPVDSGWPVAEPGSRVEPVVVVVPSSVPALLERTRDLFVAIDHEAAGVVVHELAAALGGRTETLRRLNRDAAELGETLVAGIPEFERLIDSSGPVLAALREQRDALATSFTHAADLSEVLADNRATLDGILDVAPHALRETEALVRNERANVSCVIGDFLTVSRWLAEPRNLELLAQLLDLNTYFFGGFDAGTQWDPYRPGVLWARVNLMLVEQTGAQPHTPLRATPPTLPGASCESPFGPGVDAVRQTDPPPVRPDPTSPGLFYAPRR